MTDKGSENCNKGESDLAVKIILSAISLGFLYVLVIGGIGRAAFFILGVLFGLFPLMLILFFLKVCVNSMKGYFEKGGKSKTELANGYKSRTPSLLSRKFFGALFWAIFGVAFFLWATVFSYDALRFAMTGEGEPPSIQDDGVPRFK